MSWIGIAGIGAFLATVATAVITGKGSGSSGSSHQTNLPPKGSPIKNHWS